MEQRKIKFRGWDKERKEWVYGYFYTFGDRAFIIEPGKPGIPEQHIEVDLKSVGQFTGIKDKDGEEICEGDILEYEREQTDSGGIKPIRAAIEFDAGRFTNLPWLDEDAEIIGNVWENPELLKN